MHPNDLATIGQTLLGEPWLEKMAEAIGYSTSRLWRVAFDGAAVTRRMRRECGYLVKPKKAKLAIDITQRVESTKVHRFSRTAGHFHLGP